MRTKDELIEDVAKLDQRLADEIREQFNKLEMWNDRESTQNIKLIRENLDLREKLNMPIPLATPALNKRVFGKKPIKLGTLGNRIPLRSFAGKYPTVNPDSDNAELHQMLWTEEHISIALSNTLYLYEYVVATGLNKYYVLTHTLHSIWDQLEVIVDPARWDELNEEITRYRQQCKDNILKKG